mgnify:CR=1 FL=1|jgi:FKBP-type peptidyl-prolyl cis-trans isomerase
MRVLLAAVLMLSIPAVLNAQGRYGPNPRDVQFSSRLGIDLDAMTETESGLFYRDDPVGTGEPAGLQDTVMMEATGYLVNREAFYAGRLTVTLGSGRMVAGFMEGLVGVRAGGRRWLVIPPELGYGSDGTEGVPPDAVLVFRLVINGVEGAQP